MTEYSGNTKRTFLSIFLRAISAQKLVTITTTVTNGIQGTYNLTATIGSGSLVEMQATSNSFYVNSGGSTTTTSTTPVRQSSTGTIITSTGQAISIKSAIYPNNRLQKSVMTFSITKPDFVVAKLKIKVPSIVQQSADGINCGYQTYVKNDNFFNLMVKQGTNVLRCTMKNSNIVLNGIDTIINSLQANQFLYLTI